MSYGGVNYSPLIGAIGTAEGFGVAGAIPTNANNPGDLSLGNLGQGTLGNNISVYPTPQAGTNALGNFLSNIFNGQNPNYSPTMTIGQFADTYVNGPSGGTTAGSQAWASNVASSLGASTDTQIGQALYNANQSPGNLGAQYSLNTSGIGPAGLANGFSASGIGSGSAAGLPGVANQAQWLSRGVYIIVGLIFVGAGLMMFRQSQIIIGSAGRTVKNVAALAA